MIQIPIFSLLLGAGGLGSIGYGLFRKAPAAPGAQPGAPGAPGAQPARPSTPVAPPGSSPEDMSAAIAAIRAKVEQLIAQGTDSAAMRAMAAQLEAYGLTAEADALRKRADQIDAARRAQPAPAPSVTPPFSPAVVPVPVPVPVPAAPAGFVYNPNLGDVGSGSSYNPGPVDQDAAALRYLGYNAGSPAGSRGAWDATFQAALKSFQRDNPPLVVDGWIGPKSRMALKARVEMKNAGGAAIPTVPVMPAVSPAPPAPGGMPFTYLPNLGPVGSQAQGNYNPNPVDQDAAALNFLGYNAGNPGSESTRYTTLVSTPGKGGAWNTQFQAAVRAFQQANPGLTVDGWIGPNTRKVILARVTEKNAQLMGGKVAGAMARKSVTVVGSRGRRRTATAKAPAGVRLRTQPNPTSGFLSIVPLNGTVEVKALYPGRKMETISPGPGGWAQVIYLGREGFVPSEWLVLDAA